MVNISRITFDVANQKVMFHTDGNRVYAYSVKENAMYGVKGKIVTNPFSKTINGVPCDFPQNCTKYTRNQLDRIVKRIVFAKRYDGEIIDKTWDCDLSTKYIKNRNMLYIDNGFLGITTYDFNTKKFGVADTAPNNEWQEFPIFMRRMYAGYALQECLFTYMEQLIKLYDDEKFRYSVWTREEMFDVSYITYCINNNYFPFLAESYNNYLNQDVSKKIEQKYKKNDEKTIRLMFEKGNLLTERVINNLKAEIIKNKWEKIDFILEKIVPIYKSTVAKFISAPRINENYFEELFMCKDSLDTLATFGENNGIIEQARNRMLAEKMKENQNRLNAIEQDEYRNCCVIVPKSKTDLVKESEGNHNCVGRFNSYYENCAKGLIFLVFIRKTDNKDKSYITCEFDIQGGRFVQTLGFGNRDLCRDEREIVKHYETKIKEILRGE